MKIHSNKTPAQTHIYTAYFLKQYAEMLQIAAKMRLKLIFQLHFKSVSDHILESFGFYLALTDL